MPQTHNSTKMETSSNQNKTPERGELHKCKGEGKTSKIMGAPCTSSHCKKSSLRSCQSLTEDERQEIFDRFWSISSWEERRSTVRALVDKVCIFRCQIRDAFNKCVTKWSYDLRSFSLKYSQKILLYFNWLVILLYFFYNFLQVDIKQKKRRSILKANHFVLIQSEAQWCN